MDAPSGPSGVAKLLITTGLFVAAAGGLIWLSQLLPPSFRPFRLPGDIRIVREGFSFYMPITTMVLLSLLMTGVLHLARWWKG